MTLKFYVFIQNHTMGGFDTDETRGIGVNVWIEANSAYEANSIAENIGIYFNGVEKNMDCDCCGDRWFPVSEFDGWEILEWTNDDFYWDYPNYVHRYDGKIEIHRTPNDKVKGF